MINPSFRAAVVLIAAISFDACVPQEAVVFKGVRNIQVEAGKNTELTLKADAFFHNPNAVRMKLKEISVDVWVNEIPSATVRQRMRLRIPARSDFQVPITASLSLKELGLLDTIRSLLGGKKYLVRYQGFIRVAVHGVTIKVPIDHKEEIRLKF